MTPYPIDAPDFSTEDKRKLLILLKESFSKSTDQDLRDCYAEVRPHGIAIAIQAVRQMRAKAKGGAMYRPEIATLRSIAMQIAIDQNQFSLCKKREEDERRSREQLKDLSGYWARVRDAGERLTDAELHEWKAKFLSENPDLRPFYERKNPRENRVLMAHIIEFGAAKVA